MEHIKLRQSVSQFKRIMKEEYLLANYEPSGRVARGLDPQKMRVGDVFCLYEKFVS
jgi:hypothetical protein